MGSPRSREKYTAIVAMAGLLLVLIPAPGSAQGFGGRGELPLEDLLQIVLVDRNLRALDARGGGGPTERLEIGEELLQAESRGRVGVAITDRRILAIGVGSGFWQQTRYRQRERPPSQVLLGDRLALLITGKRFLFFDGGTGNLTGRTIGLGETLVATDVASNSGVIVTNRRALGFSPFTGGFSEIGVQIEEDIEEVSALSNLVTVLTSQRLLTFRAPTGAWAETDRNLR
jgi:hypothetical protein